MQLLYTHANKLVTSVYKYVSQLHILICMLNIALCRTCSGAELAPVSPTHHSARLNAQNVINWKYNFKENII